MRKFNINVNGKAYAVEVEEVLDGGQVVVSAPKAAVAPTPKAAVSAPVAGNGEPVNAPMPGLVKKLAFANGATVKKGDTIIILEAMKMDNEITAPCDGKVTFGVSKGANVETNAVLAVIG